MEDRRAHLQSKLESLAADRYELVLQQQQLNVKSCMPHPGSSTSLISVVDDTINTGTALLQVADHCSNELQDKMLTVLDLVSLLLQRNTRPNCPSPSSAVTATSTTSTCSHLVISCLMTCCIVVIWLVEIWSAT